VNNFFNIKISQSTVGHFGEYVSFTCTDIRGHSGVETIVAAETGFEITRLQMLRNMFSLAIPCVQWNCVLHIFIHSLISV